MSKLRVWWIPQIGIGQTFYIPVETVEDGKKMMDVLAAYDLFQLQNNVKPDYSNVVVFRCGMKKRKNGVIGTWKQKMISLKMLMNIASNARNQKN